MADGPGRDGPAGGRPRLLLELADRHEPARDPLHPFSYDWDRQRRLRNNSGSTLATSDDGTGNEVRYVVHRMCSVAGAVNAPAQQCVTVSSAGAGGSKGAVPTAR